MMYLNGLVYGAGFFTGGILIAAAMKVLFGFGIC